MNNLSYTGYMDYSFVSIYRVTTDNYFALQRFAILFLFVR